ncbi:amidase signature enzyme [Hyaloscypha variabilis]
MSTPPFDVLTTTAVELQDRLKAGTLTSVEIITTYLGQIEKHNHAGAKLNAVINVAPRELVLNAAEKLDRERSSGKIRSSLHGLPIIVKDCFQFAPELGLKTTVGAVCFAEEKAKKNAELIEQLVEKGVIILGTANLSEFCGHKAENMSPGWSAVGGQTRSAYESGPPPELPEPKTGLSAPCGGSSSGSAVGVSAGFAPLSLGTETGGSLNYPASKAGLYAMRPAHGFVSSKGVFRISRSFDAIGSMAKTPYDLSLLTESILTPEARAKLPENGYQDAMTGNWDGLRIGILPSTWGGEGPDHKSKWATSPVKEIYDDVAEKIKANGGFVVYPIEIPEAVYSNNTLKYKGLSQRQVADYEFNEVIQEFCDGFEDPKIRTSGDIIEYNKLHAEIAMPPPHTNQKDLITSHSSPLSANEAAEAYREINRKSGKDGMDMYMKENNVDIIVACSDCTLVIWASNAAYPAGTVPLGNLENGYPYGLFLLARAGREDLIFRFMSAFEATFPKVKGPRLE